MYLSAWKHMGSSTLFIPPMTQLRAFNGRLCNPAGIVPNLPIELDGKTVLINVTVMTGLVDYNILLGRDYTYIP